MLQTKTINGKKYNYKRECIKIGSGYDIDGSFDDVIKFLQDAKSDELLKYPSAKDFSLDFSTYDDYGGGYGTTIELVFSRLEDDKEREDRLYENKMERLRKERRRELKNTEEYRKYIALKEKFGD